MSARRSSPAAQRNRGPIADVLARVLPPRGLVLEIASGSGEHVAFFARRMPQLEWQPSDPDPDARASIAAIADEEPSVNVLAPIALDVREPRWPVKRADAIVCINMIHASPPETLDALMAGAARTLPPGAPLVLYGPYRIAGVHTAPSNEEFDAWLKTRDPRWGVRDLELVIDVALEHGIDLVERVAMPANNFVLAMRRGRP